MFAILLSSRRMPLLFCLALYCFLPSVLCDSPTAVHLPTRILSPDNPFLENLGVNISTDDIRARLNAAYNVESASSMKRGPTIIEYKLDNPKDKSLAKRASQSYGPLMNFPQCLSCAGKAKRDSSLTVQNNFMAEQLITKMNSFATVGRCLFYGQRPTNSNPFTLSNLASDYACSFGGLAMRTIWHLWPNEGCDTDENYYCLNPRKPECCWLNPLMPGATPAERIPQAMLYFQQMSRAMALTCTGEVFTLLDNPDDIGVALPNPYESIWLTHELPALQGLFKIGIVTKLTAIRLSNKQHVDKTSLLRTATPRDVDIDWNEPVARAVKAKKLEFLRTYGNITVAEEAAKVHRRSLCGSAANQEDPTVDYFG
ncbi:hypothetical protein EJ04DRAFT_513154 [Polyplosphaeria fusca]|uniref:Uncharacterized protein n=1 Tax=Polyplosphaeria fusca TaxID=682080 RepID=A0A9P4QYS3_9PLEO|nr:hypothetical protein EJ04DRAFT_513154 [Polyplosphaeria fusca]